MRVIGNGDDSFLVSLFVPQPRGKRMITPVNVEIGEPEEEPGKIVEPIHDPVPREKPQETPYAPVPIPKREKIPA